LAEKQECFVSLRHVTWSTGVGIPLKDALGIFKLVLQQINFIKILPFKKISNAVVLGQLSS